jgi:hypothetical protein
MVEVVTKGAAIPVTGDWGCHIISCIEARAISAVT